jgi:hypothetical protein
MDVINIHKRIIEQPVTEVATLFTTLSTENDMMLATNRWSLMKLDKGLQVGSKGGHGLIKYFVTEYQPEKSITFQFDMTGFEGFHRFSLIQLGSDKTELSHTINMTTTGSATLKWALAIQWLHDAYIEDGFDKVEDHFKMERRRSNWNFYVRLLRKVMKLKRK